MCFAAEFAVPMMIILAFFVEVVELVFFLVGNDWFLFEFCVLGVFFVCLVNVFWGVENI
jgi:hypothetical protein